MNNNWGNIKKEVHNNSTSGKNVMSLHYILSIMELINSLTIYSRSA